MNQPEISPKAQEFIKDIQESYQKLCAEVDAHGCFSDTEGEFHMEEDMWKDLFIEELTKGTYTSITDIQAIAKEINKFSGIDYLRYWS